MPDWFGDFVLQFGVAVLGGFVAGRLLGIRLSWGRWLLALVVGVTAGGTIAWLVAGSPRDPRAIDTWVVFTASLLVTMAVAADPFGLAGPPGRLASLSKGIFRLPVLVDAVRRRIARSRRYAQVVRIAARHGLVARRGDTAVETLDDIAMAGRPRTRLTGRALRLTLEEAGGAFVKFGQLLSTRPDLLPVEITSELARLQDEVAPEPPDSVAALMSEELHAEPNRVFAEFDPVALAAGSIAQVHRARLTSGEQVAVKVQRPGVAGIVERDLDIARRLAKAAEVRTTWARELGVVRLADGFAAALHEELDFHVEARNTSRGRSALERHAIVRIPSVHEKLSSSRILVLEWMDGIPLRDAGTLITNRGLDRTALARGLLGVMLHQILVVGVFHADPHPGNVFVRGDGTLALIDLGSVGRLDALQQSALLRAMLALSRRDPRQLRDALLDIAEARSATDEDQLEQALGQLVAQRFAEGMKADPRLFADLMNLMLQFGLSFPPAIAAVFRALITLDGTLAQLDPDFNLVDEAKAAASSWVDRVIVPEAMHQVVAQEALSLLPVLRRLPRRIDRIAGAAERGSFRLNVRLLSDPRDVRIINDLVNRALLAVIAVALGIISVQLLDDATGERTTPLEVLGYCGLIGSVILTLRVLVDILRTDR